MLLLDVLIRYPTIALLLMLAVLAMRDAGTTNTARYAALLTVTAAALLLGTPHPDLLLPWPAHVFVRILDVFCVSLVWWFACSLFEDDFSLGWLQWLGMGSLSLVTFVYRLLELGFISYVPSILGIIMLAISMMMMAHLFYITISGRQDDVIESRRRARSFFVIGLIAVTVTILITDRIFYDEFPMAMSLFRAVVILPIVIWGLLWLTRFHPEKIAFQSIKIVSIVKPEIDPRDDLLHKQLVEEMQTKQAFMQPGLSIRSLAENLKTPEHRLRALINQGLGYRNFSSFVNYYRIEAVKEEMQRPENARIPVLTLAMKVGFNSLAPFNRAFLAINQQTPTQYRSTLYDNADHS